MKKLNIFTLLELCKTEQQAVTYLLEAGVLTQTKICYISKSELTIDLKRFTHRHTNHRKCSYEKTIFKNTFFATSRVEIHKILVMSYLFLYKTPITSIVEMTQLSSHTVCDYTLYVREMLSDAVELSDVVIEGCNIIVEVDETKQGKRKYHKGHRVDGIWVLAGIERTAEKRCFAVEIQDRSAETIYMILKKFIMPGCILYTDCFKSYIGVCIRLYFPHFTVNHSKFFVDPSTGVHTSTVEGLNNGIKIAVPARNRNAKDIRGYLWYMIWRRQNRKSLWAGFLKALKEIYYN